MGHIRPHYKQTVGHTNGSSRTDRIQFVFTKHRLAHNCLLAYQAFLDRWYQEIFPGI